MNKHTKVIFKVFDIIMIFVMIFGAPTSALAYVWTDPTDYPPGSTVWIQGNNDDDMVQEDGSPWDYLENETVEVLVDGPGEWTSFCTAVVNATGYWTCPIQLDSDPAVAVGEYNYTATGLVSGKSETGTFTDANIDRDFKQCAQDDAGYALGECHWINSILQNQNSRYFEGTSVPQRVIFPSLPATAGDSHSMLFFHEFTKGGVHAYDFLTSYAQAQTTSLAIGGFALTLNACGDEIPGPNPIDYAGICTAVRSGTNFIDVDVPDDPFVSGSFAFGDGDVQDRINEFEAQYGNRTIRIWGNAPFTSGSLTLAHDVANGGDTGDSDITYVLNWVSASTQIVVEMAGHLAVSVDGTDLSWGTGKGSGAISGGPYHFKLTEVDNTTLGQEDNQITSGDIISPARKEGMKFNDLNGNGQNDSEPGLEGWAIQVYKDTDGDGILDASEFSAGPYVSTTTGSDGSYGMQIVLTNPPEKFIVCEVAQSGWTQTSPANTVCQAGTGLAPGGWAITLNEGQLDSGNDFGNRELQASILVTKTGSETSKEGDEVTYTVTIENNGEVTVYKQSISDSLVGDLTDGTNSAIATSDCGASLGVGDTCTIVYTYTVQEGDPDPLENTVTAVYDTLSDLTGDEATNSDGHTVNLFQPSVDVEKTGDAVGKVGDEVTYTYTIHNTSSNDAPNLVLVSLVDDKVGDLTINAGYNTACDELAFDETCSFSVTWTIPSGASDPYTNTVEVHYNPQGFPNDITDSDSHSVELFTPSITIDKECTNLSKVGDPVDCTVTITNTSSNDTPALVIESISDTVQGDLTDAANYDTSNCGATLASGASCTITYSYNVPGGASDPYLNTVTVKTHPDGFTNDVDATDSDSVNLFQPSITIDKTGPDFTKVGDTNTYVITVTNTSSLDTPELVNGTLTDSLVGDLLDPGNAAIVSSTCDGSLAFGESCTVTYTYVTQDSDADPLVNTVEANFNPDGFSNDIADSAQHSSDVLHPDFTVSKVCKADTEPIPQEGPAKFTVTFTNTGDADLVVNADDGIGTFNLAIGETKSFEVTVTGPFSGQATVDNTVTGTVTLASKYELDNSYEFEESGSCDVGSRVNVLKLTDGLEDPAMVWTFKLYSGPDGFDVGTLLASDSTPPALMDFGNYNLDPTLTYTICEENVPAGWTSEWKIDTDNDGVADTIVNPYNPNADDAVPQDIGNRCFDFGTGTSYELTAGGTLVFEVNNSFPGGEPRTPGYWKNWSACTGGNQIQVAAKNGGPDAGWYTLDDLLNNPGFTIGKMILNGVYNDDQFKFDSPQHNDCVEAVRILDKSDAKTGKKMASDAAYNLATALLAAELNLAAGAENCSQVQSAVSSAQTLLFNINFTGTGSYLPSKGGNQTLRNQATALAYTLDQYNNGLLCTP